MMTLSIALCTFNGTAYLAPQLESLLRQTRTPDELVVCDDGSTDGTWHQLSAFADSAPFPVRVHANPQTLGVSRNFEKAIGLCTGDIVVLCDQDDVWRPDKLARIEGEFQSRPDLGLFFSDAGLIDAEGRTLPGSLWEQAGFTRAQQNRVRTGEAFELLLARNVVTGATMAWRTEWTKLALPIPSNIPVLHDAWIALVLSAVTPVAACGEPLIQYRRHGQQHTHHLEEARPSLLPPRHYRAHMEQLRALQARLVGSSRFLARPDADALQDTLTQRIAHLTVRTQLPRSPMRRLWPILRELARGRYHRCSRGLRSAARDLLAEEGGPNEHRH